MSLIDSDLERERRWPLAYVLMFLCFLSSSSFCLYVTVEFMDDFIYICCVLIGMSLLNGGSTLIAWSILAYKHSPLKFWLIRFESICIICIFLGSLTLCLSSLFQLKVPNFIILILSLAISTANGLVIGTILCAAPLIYQYRYRVYSLIMVALSLAGALSPGLPIIISLVHKYDFVFVLLLGAAILLVVLYSQMVLPEITLPDTEIHPLRVALKTIRGAHPLSSAICLFVSGLVVGFWLTQQIASDKFEANVNSTQDNNTDGSDHGALIRRIYLSVGILCLPSILVPVMIHYLLDYQRCCKILEPLICGLLVAFFYGLISFIEKKSLEVWFYPWIVACSLARSLLIGVAYSDLLWQVFVAAEEEGTVIPLGSGIIAITSGSIGGASGVAISMVYSLFNCDFYWYIIFWITLSICMLVLVMNIWREIWPDHCTNRREGLLLSNSNSSHSI